MLVKRLFSDFNITKFYNFFQFYICFQKFIYFKFIIFHFFQSIIWICLAHFLAQLSLPCLFFVTSFCVVVLYREWYGFEKAFFTHRRFLLYTPSQHLSQPSFIKASLGPPALPQRLHGLPLRFETRARPICLFESHSVQQKVLVSRFYLCIRGCYRLLY